MDEPTLKTLIAALEIIHNVASTNEARQQAQEYCEEMKRHAVAPDFGFHLSHKANGQPDVVRYFGLGLMEYAVRYRWTDNTLTSNIKANLRGNVMTLISQGIRPILEEKTYIKEKVASLVVEVAKREWPGTWGDMDLFIRQMFYQDESTREMALMVLRCLCEDICIYDDPVAALRKTELRAELLVIMASEAVLSEAYPDGIKAHSDKSMVMLGEPGNEGWTHRLTVLLQKLLPMCQAEARSPADEKIVVAALKVLACSLDWIISNTLSKEPVIQIVCQSLQSPSAKIRLAGAECYDVLACRNLTETEREMILWPVLDDGGMELISQAYMRYATQIVQGESYEFVKKMVQATVNLGEQQLCAKRNAHVPRELSILLQLLYSMASHPSVLIMSIVSFFWTTVLRHDTFSKNATVFTFVPPLLELYSTHLVKDFKTRWSNDAVYRHFASVDFDSTTEFQDRALHIFQRAVDVIHLGVPVVPLDGLFWVANKVAETLKIKFPAVANVKETPQFKSFDGTLTLMEVTVSSLTDIITEKTHPQSAQVLEAMGSLLTIVIDYESDNLSAMERSLSSIPAFTDMFKVNSTLLFRSLDKLFKCAEYPVPEKAAVDDTRVGERAAITLVKIGRAIPNTLFPIYGQIEAAIQRLVERDDISQGLKKTLHSFLLVVGFNSDMPLDRAAIFQKIVSPVVAEFNMPELCESLSSPRAFLTFIGVDDLSVTSAQDFGPHHIDALNRSTAITRRRILSRAVEALHKYMKETIDVNSPQTLEFWAAYLGQILPNLFSTIYCLNATSDENTWAGLSSDVRTRILTLSEEEKVAMVTGKAAASAVAASGIPTLSKLIFDLKMWLAVLRDQAYRVLAQVSLLGPSFYSTPLLQGLLEQSLFEHADTINERQFRLLINHAVQPLVLNCPESYMDSVLSHLLMVLFPYLDRRLTNDWKMASEEGLVMNEMDRDDAEDPEDMDVSDVIVREIMLRDLTRYVAGFIFSVLDFGKPKRTTTATENTIATTSSTQKEITPLALFMLSRESIAQSLIPLICHIMTFKDTRSCMRSVEAAQRVLTALVQNYPGSKAVIGVFTTMALQAAMEALHDPYHQEGQEKLIQLITEIYVDVRPLDEAPMIVFQQAVGAETERLEDFEKQLAGNNTNRTKKNALVRSFLQSIIGVAKSEWFKQKQVASVPIPSRTIDAKYERPSTSALDSAEHEDIGEGLASLFDE